MTFEDESLDPCLAACLADYRGTDLLLRFSSSASVMKPDFLSRSSALSFDLEAFSGDFLGSSKSLKGV